MNRRDRLDRWLPVFSSLQRGEGTSALLLLMNLFFLMTAYYIVKPVRDSLILADAGPEMKSYAGALVPFAFLVLVPIYGKVASRLNRIRLINGVSAFFASHLIIFYVLSRFNVSFGVVFFLWVSLFNLMLVAQFWAFTNDLYTPEQGKRLFAVVGIGSSLGAVFGSYMAGRLFMTIGPYSMLLVAAGLLAVCMALANWVHHRESRSGKTTASAEPLKSDGAFQLVFKDRYLFLIALLILLSNIVSTTGDFMLGKSVTEEARALASTSADEAAFAREYVGRFYADFYFWVNIAGAGLQIFAVPRVMRQVGIGPAILFLPMIALGGYSLLSIAPVLALINLVKIAENGTNHSLQNTARHALFLPTTREAKYKAKTAIDSFFWRAGDALSALIVFAGTSFALDLRGFAQTNTILSAVWLFVAAAIVWVRTPNMLTTRDRYP